MDKIYAYTPEGPTYPPYINVSYTSNGLMRIIIRSKPTYDDDNIPMPGNVAEILLPLDEVDALHTFLDETLLR